ncbi:hypothetical protein SLA2020_380810 [Shorea laevis]
MEYESLSRCLGGEMVDTRDSKSRAKERGAVVYCSTELRSKIWKKEVFPRLYHPVNSVPLNPYFMATYLSG